MTTCVNPYPGFYCQTHEEWRRHSQSEGLGVRYTGKARGQSYLSPHIWSKETINDFVCHNRLHGRADSISFECCLRTTTRPLLPNVSSNPRSFTPMSIRRELSVCLCWTRRRTGVRPLLSNRFWSAFRTCWMSRTSKTRHRPRPIPSIGKHLTFSLLI